MTLATENPNYVPKIYSDANSIPLSSLQLYLTLNSHLSSWYKTSSQKVDFILLKSLLLNKKKSLCKHKLLFLQCDLKLNALSTLDLSKALYMNT